MHSTRQHIAEAAGYEVEAVMDEGETKWGWTSSETGEESEMLYPTPQEAWASAADWAATNAMSEFDMSRSEWATLDTDARAEVVRDCYTSALRM